MARPNLTKIIVGRIRRLRDERGWSARELAERCAELGMPSLTRGTIAKIESYRRGLEMEEAAVIAAAFGVTIEQLTTDIAVTILHLSDLGFAAGHLFGLPVGDREGSHLDVCRALCADLDKVAEELDGVRPDLIVVSGDLGLTGRPREYDLVKTFLAQLAEHLGLGFERIAIVPGNRDVNLLATKGYFAECDADDVKPRAPYWSNWLRFASLFGAWPDEGRAVRMQAEQPWSLYEIKDLRLVVAGLNSTVNDSHLRTEHSGAVGEEQVRWFATELDAYQRRGWLRVGVVHHHPLDGAEVADENLRDTATLDQALGHQLNLLLHGNEAASGVARLDSGLLVLGTGTPAVAEPDRARANRYQLLRLSADGLVRIVRRYDLDRRDWLPDGTVRQKLSWSVPVEERWRDAHGTFPLSSSRSGGQTHVSLGWEAPGSAWMAGEAADELAQPLDSRRLLLDRVADACLARHTDAVVHRIKGQPPYLRVTYVEDQRVRQLRIGACVGPFGEGDVDEFHARVHHTDHDLESMLIYQGTEPSDGLRHYAARRGVRLSSLIQFQGLVDLSSYVTAQTERLASDQRYPPSGYVPHRFTDAMDPGTIRHDVVDELLDQVNADDGRFVLLLGDFGRGKTFALRELARRVPEERPHLFPVLLDLRALDKTNTLDAHVAAHLAAHHHDDIDMRALRYMLQQGRIVLIFDGFDELVARATYDRAADHLQTLLSGATDRAKIIVASRTQHFQTHKQVLTAMGGQVGSLPQRRILILSDLSKDQIRTLLAHQYANDNKAVERRLALLAEVPGLMALAQNPRMLVFIGGLDEGRLQAVAATGGMISPAGLYQQILDNWLSYEERRTQGVPGTPLGLELSDLWTAVTTLALRMWEGEEALIGVDELGAVARTLTHLAGGHLSAEQIAYAVGAGSLLIRTEDGLFGFLHESVMEWLVARHLAERLDASADRRQPLLERRVLSPLTVDFLCGLADPGNCRRWANTVLGGPTSGSVGRTNASRVLARLSSAAQLNLRKALLSGESLSDRAWPEADLSEADLTGARLANMDLRGAVLRDACLAGAALDETDLTGADLTGADLTGARLTRSRLVDAKLDGAQLTDARLLVADLSGATVEGSQWRRAALVNVTSDPALLSRARAGGAAVLPGQTLETETMPATVGVRFGFDEGRFPRPVAYDVDGALLAIGNEDGSVLVCDARTGTPLRTLVGHQRRAYAVQFSPVDPILATGSLDGTVRLWDANTGVCRHVLEGHPGWVWPMLFDTSGTLLAAGAEDGTVRVWDTTNGELRWRLTGHTAPIWTATFDSRGRFLATGDDGKNALVWDVRTGDLHRRLDSQETRTYWMRFDKGGTQLAGGAEDGVVRLWSPESGVLTQQLRGHGAPVYALDFHPDGGYIISADVDGVVRRWDLHASGRAAGARELGRHTGAVYRITFSPDGRLFATGDSDGAVRLWDAETSAIRLELGRHHASVWPMMFRPDGTQLATSSNDYTTKLWHTRTGECLRILRGHGRRAQAVTFSRDSALLATSGNDGVVRLWNPRTGRCERVLRHQPDLLISVVFSPDGDEIATASNDGRVYLWNARTGAEGRVLDVLTDNVWATVYSGDGDHIATANDDDTVQIMFRSTGRTVRVLHGDSGRVRTLAFSPDGRWLATGGDDHRVRLWEWQAGQYRPLPALHSGRIFSLAYHPDGTTLATASHDGTVVLWDTVTGTLLQRLEPGRGKLWSVAFHPAGEHLATAGDQEVIDVWSVRTGERLYQLRGHTRRVWSVVYSPDGSLLASSSTDGTVRIWQVGAEGPTHQATLLGLPDGWVAFTPDGRYKSAGDVSGHFWHVVGVCRFEPGELDAYLPDIREVDPDVSLF